VSFEEVLTMGPQFVRPPGLFRDTPYDYAAIARGGGLVFTAGACPLDSEGRVVGPGDLEAQARQALDNLLVALAAAGSGPAQLLKTTVYVVAGERSDLVRVWNVVADGLDPARPPSTLLGVSMLGYADQLVEIEAIAHGAPARRHG
jgi:enamine deaminase RidA (YjgF/YER057c/UK114 family)